MKRSISSKTILVHYRDESGKVFDKGRMPLRLWRRFKADSRQRGLSTDQNFRRMFYLYDAAHELSEREAV